MNSGALKLGGERATLRRRLTAEIDGRRFIGKAESDADLMIARRLSPLTRSIGAVERSLRKPLDRCHLP